MKVVKLHLGCGTKRLEGYVNVDIMSNECVDLVQNIATLDSFADGSVDEIYACHVLEHFKRNEYLLVLKEWSRVLKKGGVLRIAVPDFDSVIQEYNQSKNLKQLHGLLYGGQDYDYNFHYLAYNFEFLSESLKEVGIENVERYDWKEFLPEGFDDFSRAYIPHMDFLKGRLMSLNVVGTKG